MSDSVEFLLVETAAGHLAVETGRVRQVESEAAPARVPGTAGAVEGVVDTDGDVTVVVAAAALFGDGTGGGAGDEAQEPGELVVLESDGGEQVGLRVAAVDRVVTAPLSALSPPTGDGPVRARLAVPDGPADVPVVDVAAVRERVREA